MATFTFTKTVSPTDTRPAIAIAEQLRRAADALETQNPMLTPVTKTDAYGNTQYSWTVA